MQETDDITSLYSHVRSGRETADLLIKVPTRQRFSNEHAAAPFQIAFTLGKSVLMSMVGFLWEAVRTPNTAANPDEQITKYYAP